MPDWNTRLAVSVTDDQGNTVAVTPIDSFTPTFAVNAEALHSLELTHVGVIYSPDGITFSMTVKAIGDATAKLTALALAGKHFDVVLQETDDGHDWSFKSVVMARCLITSSVPTAATVSGAPSATFSGFSLGAKVEDKAGQSTKIP
ncbi:MAG TPA: hypothetical protein VF245_06860 [Solirubrobacterales bacterium]